MTRHPVRRGQLVVPFGVGALAVFPDGVSMMVGGLDYWFSPKLTSSILDERQFLIDEWRLRARLGVDNFRLPPDFKARRGPFDADKPNMDMHIPALRFPLEHSCAKCNRLTRVESTEKATPRCRDCDRENKRGRLNQVQFIAMCEAGHLQDFPFREWVHKTVKPTCEKSIQLFASGGASLLGVHVKCACGKQRNLAGITDADEVTKRTILSHSLAEAEGETYMCRGERPWLDDVDPAGCDQPLRGGLRSASNTYFARTVSAIYVPQYVEGVPAELLDKLQAPPLSADVALFKAMPGSDALPSARIGGGLKRTRAGLEQFDDEEIGRAIKLLVAGLPETPEEPDLKISEFQELRRERAEPQLKVRVRTGAEYEDWLGSRLKVVALIDKLRETKAFTGFSRVSALVGTEEKGVYRQLWRHWPPKQNWLPASVVFGEGLLLELDAAKLRSWEERADVRARVDRMQEHHDKALIGGRLEPRDITPRFVLLHSIAHLFIQRLSFESGYAAASLAERIYASNELDMAAVLIYTAAGDSEGTLGGLVRLGRPGYLEPVIRRAVERAHWCSADPICMELGTGGGQGPNSCNAAACHNCALLPETACEEFNRYLDRAMLIGTPGNPDLGFFGSIGELDLAAATS